MRVLVTGGAGYIGSHTAKALANAGFEPIVFDNFCTGNEWAVRWGPLVRGDLADRRAVTEALVSYKVEAVIHFAGSAYVGESMERPQMYFRNNVANTLQLLDSMIEVGVSRLVFSSSCTTYGNPVQIPISETHPQHPISPYGDSKLFIEKVLGWYAEAYGLPSAILRYFNAAGADPDAEIGECHKPETHLIPLVIDTARGVRPHVNIFGSDYGTADGTAIRDYVHVIDLADAHIRALHHLIHSGRSVAVNLGSGIGSSILEVIAAVERVSGRSVAIEHSDRRLGDPAVLLADSSRAFATLGWAPRYSALDTIIETAWRWHTRASV